MLKVMIDPEKSPTKCLSKINLPTISVTYVSERLNIDDKLSMDRVS